MDLRSLHTSCVAAALFSAAAFFLPTSLSAEIPTTTESTDAVEGLDINGLKRTKEIVVERLLSGFIGRSASQIDMDEIRAILLQTGLFDTIQVSIRHDPPSRPVIVVSVVEKWSIIALPVFGATSDGMVGGLGFIDANAFGLNHRFVAAALFKPVGWASFVEYESEPPDERSFGWAASAAVSKEKFKQVDDADRALIEYDIFFLDAGLQLKRPLGRNLSLKTGIGFRDHTVSDDTPEDGRVVPLSLGVTVGNTTWDGIFLSETSISAAAAYSFAVVGQSYPSIEARGVLERSVFHGLRAMLRAAAFHAPEAPPVFEEGPASAAVSILPSDFRSPSLAGVSLGIEARVFSLRAGTISALAAYQLAFAQGGAAGEVLAQGPFFGTRLYLAKIAVPAIDIGVAYNAETGIWRGAFGIGMRM